MILIICFNSDAEAATTNSGTFYNFNVSGFQYTGFIDIGVAYIVADTLTIGTYNENNQNTLGNKIALMDFVPNDTAIVSPSYLNGYSISHPFTLTIVENYDTTISGHKYKIVQGTFQGNIYLNGDTTQSFKVVTNGKFNVHM